MSIVNVKVQHIRPLGYANLKEWMANPQNVYVGRAGVVFVDGERFPKQASKWANPYKVGKEYTRDEAIHLFELYLRERVISHNEIPELLALKGKTLGCWCHPEPCHASVLLKLMDEFS